MREYNWLFNNNSNNNNNKLILVYSLRALSWRARTELCVPFVFFLPILSLYGVLKQQFYQATSLQSSHTL